MAKLETVDASVPAPTKRPAKKKKTFKKKREKRVVHHGIAHILASFNNTIITITDNAIIPMKERIVDEYYDPLVWIWRKITGKSN